MNRLKEPFILTVILWALSVACILAYNFYWLPEHHEEPEVVEIVEEEPIKAEPVIEPVPEIVEAEDYATIDPLELVGTFTATAYCPCMECCGIWSEDHPSRGEDYVQRTSSGTIPEEGRTIAADWDVLPVGSEVIVNGHTYVVEDTGSSVKGNRIDIFFRDHQATQEWGVQEVDVYRESGVEGNA